MFFTETAKLIQFYNILFSPTDNRYFSSILN